MTSIPVLLTEKDGQVTATALATAGLTASAETKEAAVSALLACMRAKQDRGELLVVTLTDPNPFPVREYSPEEREILDEVLADIYRARDEEKRREFPE